MKILAIDTSNQALSVAILNNEEVLASHLSAINKNHSVTLMPIVERLFKETKLTPKDIDRIAVAKGPGSYTGLRIGVTTAKTLAYTLPAELVGISSLAHLASSVGHTKEVIVPIFDARRQNVYTGAYQWQDGKLVNLIADQHIALSQWLEQLTTQIDSSLLFVGDLSDEFVSLIEASGLDQTIERFPVLNSAYLGKLAYQTNELSQPEQFVPTYLKLVEAEENWLKTNPEQRSSYVEKV